MGTSWDYRTHKIPKFATVAGRSWDHLETIPRPSQDLLKTVPKKHRWQAKQMPKMAEKGRLTTIKTPHANVRIIPTQMATKG
ncbi:hypothetical protein J4211_04115 [Candidatus Woesearchaeota archaeon]|nr:hypothetical protein [Candidatus Woesearchaeota archaeon]